MKIRSLAFVLALVMAPVLLSLAPLGASQDPGLACSPNQDCIPSPLSLAIANGGPNPFGWVPDGSRCGTQTCYVFFRCGCGSRFGVTLCEDVNFGGGLEDPPQFPSPDCV